MFKKPQKPSPIERSALSNVVEEDPSSPHVVCATCEKKV